MNTYPNQKNLEAWDQLYSNSSGLIWGETPLPFIQEWMQPLKNCCRKGDGDETAGRVLDAGTGEGRNLAALLELQCEVWACDASPHALNRIPESITSHVSLTHCELSATPFADGYFRLVVMMDVFETLPCIRDVLAEMYRILETDGCLFVNIPDHRDPISTTDMIPLADGGFVYSGNYYYHFYSIPEALKLMESAGFELLSQRLHIWEEKPHENYRNQTHEHMSPVFLLRKKAASH